MLRRKLLARLGLLVFGFVTGAAVSIALLQRTLGDLDAANADADRVLGRVQSVISAVGELEDVLASAGGAVSGQTAAVVASKLAEITDGLDSLETVPETGASAVQNQGDMVESMALARRALKQARAGLGDEPDPASPGTRGLPSHASVTALKSAVSSYATIARRHVTQSQADLSRQLRLLIIGLTIAALIMTNISIFVLIRTANMILRPVGELIEGSRQLATEHFDHRVHVTGEGEFGELASAYNSLADQLAANEQKKVKALQHLAVTLNHELNNIITAIDLQLQLMNRRSSGDPRMRTQLADIHNNLERMARTVASLRNVRRVVLIDYMPGEPMLDLPRSTAAEEPAISVRATSADSLPAPRP